MIKSYFKIAFRNLLRHKSYSVINIFGLAAGIACCLLILIFVQQEISYDRHFENADRIYRVAAERSFADRSELHAKTPRSLIESLAKDYPEIVQTTRLSQERAERIVARVGENSFHETTFYYADANFFDLFSLPLISGNPATALSEPNTIVLSRKTAEKYFPDTDPIGQTILIRTLSNSEPDAFQVTGVVEEMPLNTHFHFDFLASYNSSRRSERRNWGGFHLFTYIKLQQDAAPHVLETKFPAMVETYVGQQVSDVLGISFQEYQAAGNGFRFFLQPLTEIHLHSNFSDEIEANGSIIYVYLFTAIALFILLIACINFMNLATARSANRAKEIGIRKVMGSNRPQLIRQFLLESIAVCIIALLAAIALVQFLIPFFNDIAGQQLAFAGSGPFGQSPLLTTASLIGLTIIIGIFAGSYPALYLSGFQPAKALKGRSGASRRSPLRNLLVVFQFTVSIVLIIGTAVIYNQMSFLQNKNLGFDKAQILILEGTEILESQIQTFKEELLKQPAVSNVSHSETIPGRTFRTSGFRVEGATAEARMSIPWMFTGFDFQETYGIKLKSGRSISRIFAGDSMAAMVNASAAAALGLKDPLGKNIIRNGRTYQIVGVMDDFHFQSLHQRIGPMIFLGPDPHFSNRPRQVISAKIQSANITGTLSSIEETWEAFAPNQPFRYSFLDDNFDALYRKEAATGKIFGGFAAMAILIACLGLFGLAAFATEQRVKEIGIRKVLGATISSIVILLSKDFLRPVAIAFLVAAGIAYYGMSSWLSEFAYRIDFPIEAMILSGAAAIIIAILTVSSQAIRSALANPIQSMRHE